MNAQRQNPQTRHVGTIPWHKWCNDQTDADDTDMKHVLSNVIYYIRELKTSTTDRHNPKVSKYK